MQKLLFLLLVGAAAGPGAPTVRAEEAQAAAMAQVIARYRSTLVAGNPPSAETIRQYAEKLSPDGSWPDIRYADPSMASWDPLRHLHRVRDMARAVAAGKSSNDKARVLQAVHRALDHWGAHRYRSRNWWFNEIGVPGAMREIIVLLGDDLQGDRRKVALEVLGQFRVANTAANLMWGAELALHHGCLTGNLKQVEDAARRMWAEVAVGLREGVQRDGSFYQHGARLQTFHYGAAYLGVVANLAWQLRQTPWTIPREKRDLFSNYILQGPAWMRRGAYTVPGTLDRAVSRPGSMAAGNLAPALNLWKEVDPDRQREFQAVIDRQAGRGTPLAGYRHFPMGDFTAYHRPSASVFLKTVSERTGLTESINSENLKGVPFLHGGDHYVLQDGPEYHNLQPVWQWKHLPGLTMRPEDTNPKRTRFVGGLGNGPSGLTAMDYAREGAGGVSLSLRKTWFFHGDVVLCLMGGLEGTPAKGAVVSSLEQCRLRGPVVARTGRTKRQLTPGQHDLAEAQWILHNRIGYVPLHRARVQVFMGPRTGDWHALANQSSTNLITESVFQLLTEHGPAQGAQGWAILLDATEQDLDLMVRNPPWRVIRNDRDGQCLVFADGLRMASFFAPGSVGNAPELSVNKPCLALWNKDAVWLCDPTMAGGEVALDWQQQKRVVKLPSGGTAAKVERAAKTPGR